MLHLVLRHLILGIEPEADREEVGDLLPHGVIVDVEAHSHAGSHPLARVLRVDLARFPDGVLDQLARVAVVYDPSAIEGRPYLDRPDPSFVGEF